MSFLDSVLSSIETGKPAPIAPPPVRSPVPPVSSSNIRTEVQKPSNGTQTNSIGQAKVAAGMKRKAEDQLRRPSKPVSQTSSKPATSKPTNASTVPKPHPVTTSTAGKPTTSSAVAASQKTRQVSSKPPPPGSFADIMNKAKEVQTRAPTQVGMFKHQPVPKEKLSKMERKKRAIEAQAKGKEPKSGKKACVAASGTTGTKPGDGKPVRKRTPEQLSYKGTARPSQAPAQPEYRGTAGLPSRRSSSEPRTKPRASKRPRMNEYLATDEEDQGDSVDDYDDYYSGSSDMEAGYDDVEEEEAAALKVAKREDEEEWRAELAAKQAKIERQKKLEASASKRRY